MIQAGRNDDNAGPLEALLTELEFNMVLLQGDDYRRDYLTPAATQVDRAIATNAIALLEREVRER